MATKSEELIEKAVVPKKRGRPSLKVSKKDTTKSKPSTSKKATKKTTTKKSSTSKSSKSTSSKKEIAIKPEELIEKAVVPKKRGRPSLKISKKETTKKQNSTSKKSTKRTIKNISVKKTADSKAKDEKTISKTQAVSIKASPSKNDRNSPKKKRTLKLTLESSKQQKVPEEVSMISQKEDFSINQNSSFFNEPSIFAKFNIDITSADSEDMNAEQTNTSITSTLSELEIDDSENTTEFETIGNVDNVNTSELEFIKNTAEEINNTSIDTNDIETSNNLNHNYLIENNANNLNDSVETIDLSINNLENDIDCYSNNNELLEIDNNENVNDSSTPDIEVENEAIDENIEPKAVAESITEATFVQKSSNKGPIGKFFDSSIPSITSEKGTFSKITKSVFSSISPIFKKFTFEEVNLINNKFENTSTQIENNLTDIQKALENFTPNTANISEMPVNAEPILTIPVIEKTTETISSDLVNNKNISDYSNVLTPASDTSYDYEDELENPDEYKFSNKLIDKLEEETDFENTTSSKDNIDTSDINLDNISLENLEKLKPEEYDDETFSIESYFGIDKTAETNTEIITKEKIENNEDNTKSNIEKLSTKSSSTSSEEFINKFLETNSRNKHISKSINTNLEKDTSKEYLLVNNTSDSNESISNGEKNKDLEMSNISKLLESYNHTLSTLSEKISNLENKQTEIVNVENNYSKSEDEIIEQKLDIEDIDLDDIDINDLDLDELENLNLSFENSDTTENPEENQSSVENMLSEAFLSKDFSLDVKDELLSEVLSSEENNFLDVDLENSLLEEALLENLSKNELENLNGNDSENLENNLLDVSSDFSKIIDSLTKAITELEQAPDIKSNATNFTTQKNNQLSLELPNELLGAPISEEKAINILINKDDIFSISILNETYEIVADFDGISVLSENLHISTPKNNFFVKVENKYIEIHKQKDCFILYTNFEDIEFANAINNIAFTKKNSKIELNIKEAFKLLSVNNKIELSMLNKAIANLSSNTSSEQQTEENSICDNRTLLISEETQKVYLPYTIEEVMKKLRDSEEYQTVQEVIDNEYTLPLSTFRMPIISRFKEAYRFMRVKEKSSIYAAIDLALELMFNSNLNPAVIRAAKDMKELNIYLDCLYENEVEKFDCFKIIYKVLPKIK